MLATPLAPGFPAVVAVSVALAAAVAFVSVRRGIPANSASKIYGARAAVLGLCARARCAPITLAIAGLIAPVLHVRIMQVLGGPCLPPACLQVSTANEPMKVDQRHWWGRPVQRLQ